MLTEIFPSEGDRGGRGGQDSSLIDKILLTSGPRKSWELGERLLLDLFCFGIGAGAGVLYLVMVHGVGVKYWDKKKKSTVLGQDVV